MRITIGIDDQSDFVEAAGIFSQLRWKGVTLPPSDCLIASLALRLKLPVYAHFTCPIRFFETFVPF
jgi:predicted nucleic acid-binding protein